jgi:CHAT domain-containing protein
MFRMLRNHFFKTCLGLIITASLCSPAFAQTSGEPDIRTMFVEFGMRAYRAYERQDRDSLLSLCSAKSPHCSQFREILEEQLALTANLKLELKRILILKAAIQNEQAQVRVLANMSAVDESGHPAEGMPGEWDHTLHLIKEDGDWKLWRFTDTAEEFSHSYLKAVTKDERASLVTKAQPITFGFIRGLLEEGQNLLESRGEYRNAAEIFQLVNQIAEPKDVFGRASAVVWLGDVYLAQGDYLRAADNYQEVLTLSEKLGSKEGIAAVSVKMGNLHYQQGNLAQAMEHYLKSVRLYEELGSKIEITYPLVNLGSAYFSQGNYEQALAHYQKVYKIYQQLFAKAGSAWLLNKIADVYAAQGKNEPAIALYSQSLKAHEALGNNAMQAYSLNGLGRIRFTEGKYAEALTLFSRAAVLARTSNSPEILWKVLNLLGQTHRALREAEQAQQAFAESIAVIEQLRGQMAGTERDQALSFESKTIPYLEMSELLIEQNDYAQAFVYAERAKGRMLLAVLQGSRTDITKSMTAEERDKEKVLSAVQTAISTQLRREDSRPQPRAAELANLQARLEKARLESEAYETRIYAAHPELKVQRGESEPMSLNEASSLLPDGKTALLEYVITQERVYLFVLTRNQTEDGKGTGKINQNIDLKVYPIAIDSGELAGRIGSFRRKLADNALDFKQTAQQLYELLLRPAQRELDGKTLVCIVPANELWQLPFQALMPGADRYFLQEHAVYYVPSLSVLRELRKRKISSWASRSPTGSAQSERIQLSSASHAASPLLLALGNPALSDSLISRAKSTTREMPLNSLPEAEREVKNLGEIYGRQSSKILIGKAAREETFKAEAGKYLILHFATHGVLDNSNPLYSRLLLANSTDAEDGFLEAKEIMKLNLHADLAVLSACQTALGNVGAGEGLIGMTWALFIAGTTTTVASQWKVDSTSTARLMTDFHRYLWEQKSPAGTNKAEMLRQASLKLMSDPKYKHPLFWGGFVLVGDGQ